MKYIILDTKTLKSKMYLNGFTLVLMIVVFQTVKTQFYVDVENSLPRIGKRVQEEDQPYSNDLFHIQTSNSNSQREELITQALRLIKLLNKQKDSNNKKII